MHGILSPQGMPGGTCHVESEIKAKLFYDVFRAALLLLNKYRTLKFNYRPCSPPVTEYALAGVCPF